MFVFWSVVFTHSAIPSSRIRGLQKSSGRFLIYVGIVGVIRFLDYRSSLRLVLRTVHNLYLCIQKIFSFPLFHLNIIGGKQKLRGTNVQYKPLICDIQEVILNINIDPVPYPFSFPGKRMEAWKTASVKPLFKMGICSHNLVCCKFTALVFDLIQQSPLTGIGEEAWPGVMVV